MAVRVAYLVTRDHAEAQDVAQDAFVKAYQALERFEDGRAFRPWLLRIVRNEAVNRVRHRERQGRLALKSFQPNHDHDPAEAAARRVQSEHLLTALEQLPDPYREVLTHRFLMELSEDETAQTLGIPRGTVKSRTSRAIDHLRAVLPAETRGIPDA